MRPNDDIPAHGAQDEEQKMRTQMLRQRLRLLVKRRDMKARHAEELLQMQLRHARELQELK